VRRRASGAGHLSERAPLCYVSLMTLGGGPSWRALAFVCAALAPSASALGCHCGGEAPAAWAAGASASLTPPAPPAPPAPPLPRRPRDPAGFLKGQLHAHSNGSGDSDTPPGEVAAWYAARGYDFIVLTDHNRVTDTDDPEGMLTLPGVELTQNLRTCNPPPSPWHACLLHVNALFLPQDPLAPRWEPLPAGAPSRREDIYGRAVAAAQSLGGIAQLNHPNFHFGADASLLVSLSRRGLLLVEIANQAVDSANEGDSAHPPVEALWDEALSRGARLFGTATDDAHHYVDAEATRARGETAYVGDLGFVMVRAERSAQSIRSAIARGDFYSSTGVLLDQLVAEAERLSIAVRDLAGPIEMEVIGQGGAVLQRVTGPKLDFNPKTAPPGYVRVRISDARGRRAWTQPIFVP
jgi:hypothetical protein